jgi:hypothetical protein
MPSKNNDKQQVALTITKDFKQDATKAEKIFIGQHPIVMKK